MGGGHFHEVSREGKHKDWSLQKGTRKRALLRWKRKAWDRMSLKARLTVQCLLTAVVTGAMLFLPAGTFRFWQGWIFLGLLTDSDGGGFIYFFERDPQLVERRLQGQRKSRRAETDYEIREGDFHCRFFASWI